MKLRLICALALTLLTGACAHVGFQESTPFFAKSGWVPPREPASETGHALYTLDSYGKAYISYLEHCSGTASLIKLGDDYYLRIRNSDCGNIVINDQAAQKMDGQGQGGRYADVRMDGDISRAVTHRIVLRSNSGKTSDTIRVTVRPSIPTARNSDWVLLSDCGGYAQVVVQNGQVNLKFKEVSRCSVFDIVSDNGDTTVYPAKEFPNSNASFTLPKRVMEFGFNRVLIQVRDRSGWIEDKFYVSFLAM